MPTGGRRVCGVKKATYLHSTALYLTTKEIVSVEHCVVKVVNDSVGNLRHQLLFHLISGCPGTSDLTDFIVFTDFFTDF